MRHFLPLAGDSMDSAARRRCEIVVQRALIVREYDRGPVTIILCGGKCPQVAGMSLAREMQKYIEKYIKNHSLDISGIKILCSENDTVMDIPDQITCAQRILTASDPWPRVDFFVNRSNDVSYVGDILSRFPDIHPGCICPIFVDSWKSRPYKVKKGFLEGLYRRVFPHSRFLST